MIGKIKYWPRYKATNMQGKVKKELEDEMWIAKIGEWMSGERSVGSRSLRKKKNQNNSESVNKHQQATVTPDDSSTTKRLRDFYFLAHLLYHHQTLVFQCQHKHSRHLPLGFQIPVSQTNPSFSRPNLFLMLHSTMSRCGEGRLC